MARLEGLWQLETAYGDVLELSGMVIRMTGWGMAGASYVGQRTPTQHGSSHLGFRLEDREIIFGLLWHGKWASCLAGKRVDLGWVFSYLSGPLILRRSLNDQTVRELRRCWFSGDLSGDSEAAWDDTEMGAVRLLCRDPAWYGAEHTITSVYDDFTPGLYSSELVLDSAGGLSTDGNWYAFPTIIITGPCTSFDLVSDTTGQRLRYTGAVLAGETVTLVTNPSPNPSATHSVNGDVQNYVPPGDDLGGFCLWPRPLATLGANQWTLTVAGIEAASTFSFTWEDRWQGI